MVEPNQTKGKKNKNRTLPGTSAADESKTQASDASAAATQQESAVEGEDTYEEEVKG